MKLGRGSHVALSCGLWFYVGLHSLLIVWPGASMSVLLSPRFLTMKTKSCKNQHAMRLLEVLVKIDDLIPAGQNSFPIGWLSAVCIVGDFST